MTAWALLEMLAWAVLVVEHRWLMRKDFDKLSASSDVRLLLSWCSIPIAVPTQLQRLAGFAAADSNLADAPGTVGWIRNRLTHPPSKLEKGWPEHSELIESWRLEMGGASW